MTSNQRLIIVTVAPYCECMNGENRKTYQAVKCALDPVFERLVFKFAT